MRFPTTLTAVAVLAALGALVLASAAAAENGGNSANAKLCQKGGWEELVDADGGAFANAGACVSYAARGGTFGQTAGPTWSLVVSACATPLEGFTCAKASGSGLLPGTTVNLYEGGLFAGSATVAANGTVSVPDTYRTCEPGSYTWHAAGTAADGTSVSSAPVELPCA
ncbi:MAG: hypothetical protein ICV64_09860 [Thermoleophilia bacterium]|nr:hypothetical protein [Thermoleophilia bacterium]